MFTVPGVAGFYFACMSGYAELSGQARPWYSADNSLESTWCTFFVLKINMFGFQIQLYPPKCQGHLSEIFSPHIMLVLHDTTLV